VTTTRKAGGGYFTAVRNMAKIRRPFGYLGQYGREVDGGAEFVLAGLVEEQPGFNERKRKSFERDKAEGRILVTIVPAEVALARHLPDFPKSSLGYSC
jgi:hypothetical protein